MLKNLRHPKVAEFVAVCRKVPFRKVPFRKVPFHEGKLRSREENRGGKAIFRRGRLKSEDCSKGGEDVEKSTAS